MHDDTTDTATAAFSAERDAAEFSPAQPEGDGRIDADGEPAESGSELEIKPERSGRMTH